MSARRPAWVIFTRAILRAMDKKRPIDRVRDAGGTMKIGTVDDTSAVTEMIPVGGILHAIKEDGIYSRWL